MIALILSAISIALPVPAVQSTTPTSYLRYQEPVDERPEVKALVEEFLGHIEKRGKEDKPAIGVIDKLLTEFKASGPKDRESIVRALDRSFEEKRQESAEGVRDNQLFLSSAIALGEMAPESVPVLLKWIGNKAHRKDVQLQRTLIQRLGRTKSEDARKPLIKLLNDKDAAIQAATGEALGEYADADQKVRKENFEELMKVLMAVKGQVDTDSNDTIARDRYDAISAPIITSLQRLSKHEESDPNEWQRWWNKNKKEDWDAQNP